MTAIVLLIMVMGSLIVGVALMSILFYNSYKRDEPDYTTEQDVGVVDPEQLFDAKQVSRLIDIFIKYHDGFKDKKGEIYSELKELIIHFRSSPWKLSEFPQFKNIANIYKGGEHSLCLYKDIYVYVPYARHLSHTSLPHELVHFCQEHVLHYIDDHHDRPVEFWEQHMLGKVQEEAVKEGL